MTRSVHEIESQAAVVEWGALAGGVEHFQHYTVRQQL